MCENIFCEGEVEFEVVYGLDRVSGYVKIPKQECTSSDDDFEIWLYTENGEIEDCNYHGWINPYIHEFIWGGGLERCDFLEIICDKAHKKETVEEYNYTNNKGEEIFEMTLITNGSTFKWDVEE